MKLVSMTVSGFRGLPQLVTFDLDADAVILVGVNGSGKTSFFDAILWALSGRVDRIVGESGPLVSKYSPSGEARVELTLRSATVGIAKVVRRFDGQTHLSIQLGDENPLTGPAAEAALLDLLWPDAQAAPEPLAALSRSLTRATYLQQDAVREFVTADDEQTRFQVVGELVGVGRVTDLQRQLESARNAWTRATTSLERELAPYASQRSKLLERLGRLPESDTNEIAASVDAWQRESAEILQSAGVPAEERVEFASGDAVDLTVAALTRGEQFLLRRLNLLERLRALLANRPAPAPDLGPLESAILVAEDTRERAAVLLASAEAAASAQRRMEVELRDAHESLRALAQLALRHLDDLCPVCAQPYDHDATHARLSNLVDPSSNDRGQDTGPSLNAVADAARNVEQAEQVLAEARESLRNGRESEIAYSDWRREAETLQETFGLAQEATAAGISSLLESVSGSLTRTREVRAQGERLALEAARIAEQAQRHNLVEQLAPLEASIAERQATIDLRNETSEEVSSIISALRDANDTLVAEKLTRIEPLLQRVFAAVDPHPTFRAVNFLTRTERGRGRLWTTLGDVPGGVSGADPAMVLSSSQLNVLAVSVFLALNLAIPTLPLQVVALDDPLQSLDNVNLLGLTDLLRRVKGTRQVLVSTHDNRLAGLLERKLRPVGDGTRTVRIDLRGWSSLGPTVQHSVVEQDSGALKLVASA